MNASQLLDAVRGLPSFATDDPDEADAGQAQFGRIRRQVLGRGPLGLRAWRILRGSIGLSWSTSAIEQKVSASNRVPIVHLPLGGPLSYRVGRRHFDVMPGEVVFLPSGTDYVTGFAGGVTTLGFIPDEEQLAAELAARGHARQTSCVVSARVGSASGSPSPLASIIAGLRELPASEATGPALPHFEAGVTSWLADTFGDVPGGPSSSAMAQSRMQRVEEWIDAHLGEPITLGRLCLVAGLEASALHKAFKRRRGVSPMRWVFSRRMAAARLRLMEAGPAETVIRIAHDCGLVHAGRFSLAYRHRYGESPSLTRDRALGLR